MSNQTAPVAPTAPAALPKLPRTRKPKTPQACHCGCAQPTKGGRFVPGHDAILHGWVLRVERGVVAEAPAPHTAAVATLIAAKQAKTEAAIPTNVDPMVALQVAAATPEPEAAPARELSRQERKLRGLPRKSA